jgi:hypothetical protein
VNGWHEFLCEFHCYRRNFALSLSLEPEPESFCLQVTLVPPAPVLSPGVTTSLDIRFRPLLVGSSEASLRLDSTELGLYEWKLKLTGAPTIPERPLTFSVPLGTREVQVRSRQAAWVRTGLGSISPLVGKPELLHPPGHATVAGIATDKTVLVL